MNIGKIRAAIDEVLHAVSRGDRDLAERTGLSLTEVFEREFICETESDYTPEVCSLQLAALEALLELHIMRGEPLDISVRFGQLIARFRSDMNHFPAWTDEERKPAAQVLLKAKRSVEAFYTSQLTTKHQPYSTAPGQCPCMLCRKKMADKTGSHMVPHFLIAKVFSYDGSTHRDKVMVQVDNLSEGNQGHYFGAQVYGDTISEIIGRELTDEEVDNEIHKTNALTIDYIFCKDCEDKFSVLESYYADILRGKIKDYPPAIPYLFWISVMWRMSVGKMGTVLETRHEEALRKILNSCLSLTRDGVVTEGSRMGHCAYSLYEADDTRDEALGILGSHSPTIPYQALIGGFLINFYMNVAKARKFCKKHHLPIEDLNTGKDVEKRGNLSFIEFWQAKRQILDMAWAHDRSVWNIGGQSSQTLSQYKKLDKETESFIERLTGEKVQMGEDVVLSSWATSENGRLITLPKPVMKILDWVKTHDDSFDADQMEKDLGYSKDELAVFMQWYVEHIDFKLSQQAEEEHFASVMLDIVGRI